MSPSGNGRGRDAAHPRDVPSEGWKDVAARVKQRVKADNIVLTSAGVAFFGFLAIIPALAAVVSVSGMVLSPERARQRLDEAFDTLPDEARELLTSQLEGVAGSSGGALSLSLAFSLAAALWVASGGMGHLIEAVNLAYEERDDRGFVARKTQALLFTLGAVVLMIAALAALAALPAVLGALDWPGWLQWILNLAVWPILGLAMVAGLSLLYRKAPDRRDARWGWVTWGAVIAVVVWIIVSIGFQIYVANFASYNETYGSLAAVAVLLIWLWLTALAIILGATINAELEHQTASDTTVEGDHPLGSRDAEMADTIGQRRS
jgi:membrane protein